MMSVGVLSDPGRVRKQNQDHYGIERQGNLLLAVVADGMGGHSGGEVASRLAVTTLLEHFHRSQSDMSAMSDGRFASVCTQVLRQGFLAANLAVYEEAQSQSDLKGMGTTLTAFIADSRQAVFAHVGDTRAYHFRQGALHSVTEDHSLVAQLIRQGDLSASEADAHPQRHIITRAVGTEPDLEVDTSEVSLTVGDHLVLASDGLTALVQTEEIAALVTNAPHPDVVARQAVALANERGGHDNITVLVVRVDEEAGV